MSKSASSMLSLYSGRIFLGAIIARGRQGFEAFDLNDAPLGIYTTREAAIAAVSAAANTPAPEREPEKK
jgi:hypothetical protein